MPLQSKKMQGFTLIEMMITVAIIAILAAVAYPSYTEYVKRSNRSEGQALLSDTAAAQERYYSQNNVYITDNADIAKLNARTDSTTGKYFEDTDKDGNKSIAQSAYGIWDKKTRGEKNATNTLSISRSDLVTQTIGSEVTATDSESSTTDASIISENPIPWDEKAGWKLDLKQGGTFDGEMVIEPMVNIGQTVYFQSLVPNSDPCADGASNWTYGINAFTGGKTPYNAFDMKQVKPDGTTAIVSAIRQDGEGGLSLTDTPEGLQICTGQGCEKVKSPPNINSRNSWRRIEETE